MTDQVQKFVLAFVGTAFGLWALPKVLKLFVRKTVLSILGEIVVVILTGLLTEKALERLEDGK